MVRPIRINKIKVKIRFLSTLTTVKDADFREAKQNRVYGPEVELIGQIVGMKPFFRLKRTKTGDAVPSQAHVLFRTKDMDDLGVSFKKGDKLTEVDGVVVDFQCVQAVRASPWGGGFSMSTAKPILWHTEWEQQLKQLGSI